MIGLWPGFSPALTFRSRFRPVLELWIGFQPSLGLRLELQPVSGSRLVLGLCSELMAVPFQPPRPPPSLVPGADLHKALYDLLGACAARPFVPGEDWRPFPQWKSGVCRSLAGSLGFGI